MPRIVNLKGGRPQRPPFDAEALEALALRYVGRYATTRAKLDAYLRRKLAERGAAEAGAPDIAGIVARVATLGYVDDRAFAEQRSTALVRRGYGARRVAAALDAAGVGDDDRAGARAIARDGAFVAALALARRRRIGPFATVPQDRAARERAMALLIRAGHDYALARRIAHAQIDEVPDE